MVNKKFRIGFLDVMITHVSFENSLKEMDFSRQLIWGINLCWPSKLIQIYLPDKCGEQYIVFQNTVPDKDNMSLSKPIYPYGDVMRRVTTGAGFDMIMGKIGSTPTWSYTMDPKHFWIRIINITPLTKQCLFILGMYIENLNMTWRNH